MLYPSNNAGEFTFVKSGERLSCHKHLRALMSRATAASRSSNLHGTACRIGCHGWKLIGPDKQICLSTKHHVSSTRCALPKFACTLLRFARTNLKRGQCSKIMQMRYMEMDVLLHCRNHTR